MRLLSLITLFVPCLALATPKVNLAVCFFMRNNADQKWEQYGSSGSSRYFDLPENQRKLHYGFWTAQEGHCIDYTGMAGEPLQVRMIWYKADRIDFINDDCSATGLNVQTLSWVQKVLDRGESFNHITTFPDRSQVLSHILFTPYDKLGGDILKFAEEYCTNYRP